MTVLVGQPTSTRGVAEGKRNLDTYGYTIHDGLLSADEAAVRPAGTPFVTPVPVHLTAMVALSEYCGGHGRDPLRAWQPHVTPPAIRSDGNA